MLYGTVDEAVHQEEIDWAAPRPEDWARGGGWGAQRTVLFSGLRWGGMQEAVSMVRGGMQEAVRAGGTLPGPLMFVCHSLSQYRILTSTPMPPPLSSPFPAMHGCSIL